MELNSLGRALLVLVSTLLRSWWVHVPTDDSLPITRIRHGKPFALLITGVCIRFIADSVADDRLHWKFLLLGLAWWRHSFWWCSSTLDQLLELFAHLLDLLQILRRKLLNDLQHHGILLLGMPIYWNVENLIDVCETSFHCYDPFNIILPLYVINKIVMHFLKSQVLDYKAVGRHLSLSSLLFICHLLVVQSMRFTSRIEIFFQESDASDTSRLIRRGYASLAWNLRLILVFDWGQIILSFLVWLCKCHTTGLVLGLLKVINAACLR